MKIKLQLFLRKFTTLLEYIVAGLLCIAVLYFTFQLLGSILRLPSFPVYENFEELLNTALSLVIGIEVIQMLFAHLPETVFDVLIFAVARQVVISHTSALDNLLGILAVVILFAARKYVLGVIFPSFRWKRKDAQEEPVHDCQEDQNS